MKDRTWPVNLKVDIDPEGLRHIVEEGRLIEFVNAFSKLAAENIKLELVEQLAAAAVGMEEQGKGVTIKKGFLVDEPYGTGPFPWPWPGPIPWYGVTQGMYSQEVGGQLRQTAHD